MTSTSSEFDSTHAAAARATAGHEPALNATAAIRTDAARLAALHSTGLLDTEVEEVFDRLTRLAVRLLGVPASFISLVDADRDFYKSACGFGEPLRSARELRGPTFCHYTVQRTAPLVIDDTAADPVYREVPTVKSLGVAAYVGVPLVVSGQVVGAFCTIDVAPRHWSADEVEVLVELAASAQREIELRGALALATRVHREAERQHEELVSAHALLQEQAVEMEMQAEELRATAAHLEERTEEAETANHAKTKFLSMMSHELRTPLNAISGYAELIAMGVRGPVTPEQVEFLSRIQRAGRHLQTLIGDILEYAKLDAGQVRFDLADVPMASAAAEAAELVSANVAERAVEFDYADCARSPLVLRADVVKLRQVLVNLLVNAIKFTPAGGRVWMRCGVAGSHARIAISDTGRGVPAADLARVFEPFVQLDRNSGDVREQGVGLGLAICRELARGMSGEITVESEVGRGSTFAIMVPLAPGSGV